MVKAKVLVRDDQIPLETSYPSKGAKPTFGFWRATALVVGNMIGTGIFFLPSSLAKIGPISIVGWMATALGALCLAFIYARLSRFYPKEGGPYIHSLDAFGQFIGFLMGWGYCCAIWTSNAAIALAFAQNLSLFIPSLVGNNLLLFSSALGILWLTTLFNCFGVKVGGAIQLVTSIIKVIPLLIISVVGLFFMDFSHFTPLNLSEHSHMGAINAAAALTLWAFIGLESATVPADRIKNPGRTIERATLFGTSLGAGCYILTTIVLIGVIPLTQLATSASPFVDAATSIFGSWIAPFVGICILISIFGGLNGWILLQGEMPYAMAKNGLFPKAFLRLSAQGAPLLGLILPSILISLLMFANLEANLSDLFNEIILVGAVMTLFAYLASALSVFYLFPKGARDSETNRPILSPGLKFAIVGGCFYALWAIWGSGISTLCYVAMGYGISIPLYLWSRQTPKSL